MVSAQSKNMDQVRIVVILFYPLLGQRLNLIINLARDAAISRVEPVLGNIALSVGFELTTLICDRHHASYRLSYDANN